MAAQPKYVHVTFMHFIHMVSNYDAILRLMGHIAYFKEGTPLVTNGSTSAQSTLQDQTGVSHTGNVAANPQRAGDSAARRHSTVSRHAPQEKYQG